MVSFISRNNPEYSNHENECRASSYQYVSTERWKSDDSVIRKTSDWGARVFGTSPYLISRKLVKALNIVQKPKHSIAEIGGRVVL